MLQRNSIKTLLMATLLLAAAATSAEAQFKIKKKSAPAQEPKALCAERDILSYSTIHHEGFDLSYDGGRMVPRWVAYELTAKKVAAFNPDVVPDAKMSADPAYSGQTVKASDFRGQDDFKMAMMAPYEDMMWSKTAVQDAYRLTNVAPMAETLYIGNWYELEVMARYWASKYGSLYVISGTLFTSNAFGTLGSSGASIPDAFFKMFAQKRDGEWVSILYVLPNVGYTRSLNNTVFSASVVPELLNVDLFAGFTEADAIYASMQTADPNAWVIPVGEK